MPQGKQTVSDPEILSQMENAEGPAVTASELADACGMSVEGMRNRLQALASRGAIGRKKTGHRTVIWWPQQR